MVSNGEVSANTGNIRNVIFCILPISSIVFLVPRVTGKTSTEKLPKQKGGINSVLPNPNY